MTPKLVLNIILLALWFFLGLGNLCIKELRITRLSYFCVWSLLMLHMIEEITSLV